MKIPVIKKLVESFELQELQEAEESILEGREPAIEIDGQDEGEKLTHVMAAAWVMQKIDKDGIDIRQAIRDYSVKVRNSIN